MNLIWALSRINTVTCLNPVTCISEADADIWEVLKAFKNIMATTHFLQKYI